MPARLQFFEPASRWPYQIEAWLLKYTKGRLTLHIPCGLSKVGDVRADIDSCVKPDIICDIHHPPFRPHTFDLVITDPPWSNFSKQKWIHKLADLTKDEFLLNSPAMMYRLKNFTTKIILITRTNKMFIGIWTRYARKYKIISQYS